ncbi:uncharacterized protein LOC143218197 [Lasioglossum baleicum]|uniref:uncharacterized protein LOC143218197 n=1 Tax=Lasioglossum baleicum TaxID=434251 RepID=UPI003FCEC20A
MHQQDLYTLPCESFSYIEGKIILAEAPPQGTRNNVILDTNCAAFMFDEIRYELNGVEIDRCRNPGITTSLKTHVSISPGKSKALATAGWHRKLDGADFNFCIPFNMLFGFGEDYNKITVNVRQELVLIRSRNDLNALNGSSTLRPEIELFKVQWRMTHISLEENDKKNQLQKSANQFDDCKLLNIRLYLNSESYPYDDLNLDFEKNKYAILYDMYTRFQNSYYGNRSNFECRDNVPVNTAAYCLIIHDRIVEYSPLTNVVRRIL